MKLWLHDSWKKAIRQEQGEPSFEFLWRLAGEEVETPNRGRGGESGVWRITVALGGEGPVCAFVKRQVNHLTRSLLPWRRQPTVLREREALRHFDAVGIEVPEILAWGEDRQGGAWRAFLITRGLAPRIPLDELLGIWRREAHPGVAVVRDCLAALAQVVRRVHDEGWRHGSLYPKHLFVMPGEPARSVALIDLEKARPVLRRRRHMLRDLDAFNRRTPWFSRSERLFFLKAYLGERWRAEGRTFWEKLARRAGS